MTWLFLSRRGININGKYQVGVSMVPVEQVELYFPNFHWILMHFPLNLCHFSVNFSWTVLFFFYIRFPVKKKNSLFSELLDLSLNRIIIGLSKQKETLTDFI